MAKKKSTAVAKKGTSALAAYKEYEGAGYEGQTQEDIAIPFLSVLQATSPQVEEMKNAKAGMLFNTVTEELTKEVLFIPSKSEHCFVEWVPREKGGGFVQKHKPGCDLVNNAKSAAEEFGKLKTENGNDLVETFYYYGMLVDEKEPLGPAVIAFTSTKIKVYRRFNTRINTFMLKTPDGRKMRPPMFSHVLRISSVPEENNKGKFFNFKLESANTSLADSMVTPDDPRFQAAAEIYELINSGVARAAYETATHEPADSDGDDPF